MSNQLVKFNTSSLQSMQSLQENLAQAANQIVSGTSNIPILSFNKGHWCYGTDQEMIEQDSQWAIDPSTLRWGWIRWGSGKLLGEQTVPITEPRPAKPPVPEDGELDRQGRICDWQEKYSVHMKCINGEDAGLEVIYPTNSDGGRKVIGEYVTKLMNQIAQGSQDLAAIVELNHTTYKHSNKEFGTIAKPIFNYVEWAGIDEGGDDAEEQPKALEAENDAGAEEEQAQEQPRRRRSRRQPA